jgi:hypothetical protein
VAELGDCRRFASSDDAVRHSGLDVTVHQSDNKRAAGHLSHEGPELLRWALFEAAHQSARRSSPDHDYYLQVAGRIDHNRACLSVARKLCRRAHHILRELGDQALAPVESEPQAEQAIQAAAKQASTRARQPIVTQMLCGRLPYGACRQASTAWTASKDRAAASKTRGDHTPSIILSPDDPVRAPR